MRRLIDAEEFKKQIAGMAIVNNYPPEKANALCKLINAQPTAYDQEKVVEQLEYQKNIWNYDEVADVGLVNEKRKAYTMAIKIVKGGGVDG